MKREYIPTTLVRFVSIALFCVSSLMLAAQDKNAGVTLIPAGDGNTIIKTYQQQRYVLFPIEENASETSVKVIADNVCVQELKIRLAVGHVDYYVPFDLNAFQGKKVSFVIHMLQKNAGNQVSDLWSREIKTSDIYDIANREKFRPAFHHSPDYGWMNDPNGMFYKDGEWHLCYQHNLYGSMWGNMSWGHAVSKDLIHWKQLPTAIDQDAWGTIFSGSSVVDKNNTAGFGKNAIIAIYTSCDQRQMQSLSYSTDNGRTFHKYADNPIIISDKECRDPKVFWNEKAGKWNLILASALEHEMWIYSSDDLKHWNKESVFGKGYGCQAGVWECPDLMELPVRGTKEKKWIMIVNLNPGGLFGGSATQYFTGDFDGKTFVCDTKPETTKWMDYGKDHYATVSWSNQPEGRHLVMAWMSNWQYASTVPTQQYRSANSLPRELSLYKTAEGEYNLVVEPAKEIESMRMKPMAYGAFSLSNKETVKALPTEGVCEIDISLKPTSAQKVVLKLSNRKGEEVVMIYDRKDKSFSMDRTKSGLVGFSDDFPVVTQAPCPIRSQQTLRLFIDRSSIEAFDGEGRFSMSNIVFPSEPYTNLSIQVENGSCKVSDLTIYPMNPKR